MSGITISKLKFKLVPKTGSSVPTPKEVQTIRYVYHAKNGTTSSRYLSALTRVDENGNFLTWKKEFDASIVFTGEESVASNIHLHRIRGTSDTNYYGERSIKVRNGDIIRPFLSATGYTISPEQVTVSLGNSALTHVYSFTVTKTDPGLVEILSQMDKINLTVRAKVNQGDPDGLTIPLHCINNSDYDINILTRRYPTRGNITETDHHNMNSGRFRWVNGIQYTVVSAPAHSVNDGAVYMTISLRKYYWQCLRDGTPYGTIDFIVIKDDGHHGGAIEPFENYNRIIYHFEGSTQEWGEQDMYDRSITTAMPIRSKTPYFKDVSYNDIYGDYS